jgi:hypothetical protein
MDKYQTKLKPVQIPDKRASGNECVFGTFSGQSYVRNLYCFIPDIFFDIFRTFIFYRDIVNVLALFLSEFFIKNKQDWYLWKDLPPSKRKRW